MGAAAICRVRLRGDNPTPEDALQEIRQLHGKSAEVQILDQEDERTYSCFVKVRMRRNPLGRAARTISGCVTTPLELKDGRLRLMFLGSAMEIQLLMSDLKKGGAHYRVVRIDDARFSADSLLNQLTERQRKVLLTAFGQGYYDRPRRIDTSRLARGLGVSSSTFVAHRIKAERRLIAAALKQD